MTFPEFWFQEYLYLYPGKLLEFHHHWVVRTLLNVQQRCMNSMYRFSLSFYSKFDAKARRIKDLVSLERNKKWLKRETLQIRTVENVYKIQSIFSFWSCSLWTVSRLGYSTKKITRASRASWERSGEGKMARFSRLMFFALAEFFSPSPEPVHRLLILGVKRLKCCICIILKSSLFLFDCTRNIWIMFLPWNPSVYMSNATSDGSSIK